MEKIDKQAVIDILNEYMADDLDKGYLTAAINKLPVEKSYTTRNDEVVAIIQDRINYLDGIKVLNSHNSTRIHELTDLLTKLKEDKK